MFQETLAPNWKTKNFFSSSSIKVISRLETPRTTMPAKARIEASGALHRHAVSKKGFWENDEANAA
jgi:hypothetical protein